MKKKIVLLTLCLALLVCLVPAFARAEGEPITDEGQGASVKGEDLDLPDSDALFSRYVERQLKGGRRRGGAKSAGAGQTLSGVNEAVYSKISPLLTQVADGLHASTEFSFTAAELGFDPVSWTAAGLGLSSLYDDNGISQAAKAAVAARVAAQLDLSLVLSALMADNPYDLYWFDKTVPADFRYGLSALGDTITVTNLLFRFPVLADYAAAGQAYAVDASVGETVQAVKARAQAIVDRYRDLNDYQKLDGYRREICALTAYNHEALEELEAGAITNGNPWQLLWVFDGDPETSVVCEGYAKAFQYLCDLTAGWESDQFRCMTVSGTMHGATGAGPHMWNVVRMDDGHSYVVDVTNCDAGTVGAGRGLFLVGADAIEDLGVSYEYGSDTNAIYPGNCLAIPAASYSVAITAAGYCGDSLEWSFSEKSGFLTVTGAGPMDDGFSDQLENMGIRDKVVFLSLPDGLTTIGSYAFNGCSKLMSVDIPASVTVIGAQAFMECSALASVTIPDGVTTIGNNAFTLCGALTSIVLPDSVTSLGTYVFTNCTALTSVTYSSKLTTIPSMTFANTGLTSFVVPQGVQIIDTSAFASCKALVYVVFPRSLTNINGYAFDAECTSLTTIYYQGTEQQRRDTMTIYNNAILSEVQWRYVVSGTCGTDLTWTYDEITGKLTVAGSGPMLNFNSGTQPWFSFRSNIRQIVLLDGVTGIGGGAFTACTSLQSVTIPDSVTSIGADAFSSCKALTAVDIPAGVTSIGANAFMSCTSLSSADIPVGVTAISSRLFYGCTGLTDLTIPAGVTAIGSNAFYNCTQLTDIHLPASVISVGQNAFAGTGWWSSQGSGLVYLDGVLLGFNAPLPQNVTIAPGTRVIASYAFGGSSLAAISLPSGVTHVGGYAFYNCPELESVSLPATVVSIGECAFEQCSSLPGFTVDSGNDVYCAVDGVLFSRNRERLYVYPAGNERTSYAIPSGVKSIENYAFRQCGNLTSVTIPNSVTSIGQAAFQSCAALASITIPNSVTTLGSSAFSSCDALQEAVVGSGVTRLPTCAFTCCRGLTSIVIGDGVTYIEDNAVSFCDVLQTVTLGTGIETVESGAFRGDTAVTTVYYRGTQTQMDALLDAMGHDLDPLLAATWHVADGTCGDNLTWVYDASTFTLVITGSGDMDDYSNANPPWHDVSGSITALELPHGLTHIGIKAFNGCTGLSSITIPNGVTSIGDRAFYGCTGLRNVYYGGTQAERQRLLTIGNSNAPLTSAAWHYLTVTGVAVLAAPQAQAEDEAHALDLTDGLFRATYDDLSEADMALTLDMISGYEPTAVGEQTLTVTYEDKTATFGLTVAHTEGEPGRENQVDATASAPGSYDEVVHCTYCDAVLSTTHRVIPQLATDFTGVVTYRSGKEVYLQNGTTAYLVLLHDDNEASAMNAVQKGKQVSVRGCTVAYVQSGHSVPELTDAMIVSVAEAPSQVAPAQLTLEQLSDQRMAQLVQVEDTRAALAAAQLQLPLNDYEDEQVLKVTGVLSANGTGRILLGPVVETQALHEHAAGQPQKENEKDPTDTEDGSYDLVTYCQGCGAELSRETVIVHVPGDARQENVVPATDTTRGSYDEVVCCAHCGAELSRETIYLGKTVGGLTIVEEPRDARVHNGDRAEFSVTVSGKAKSIQWYCRKTPTAKWSKVKSATKTRLTVAGSSANNGYQYRCELKIGKSKLYTDVVNLAVWFDPPVIQRQPENVVRDSGKNAAFVVEATNAEKVQWYYRKNAKASWTKVKTGGTGLTLTVAASSANNGYQYRCDIRNNDGQIYSDIVSLTVIPHPPKITTQPRDVTVDTGAEAAFTVEAEHADSIQWSYRKSAKGKWTTMKGETRATLTVTATSAKNGYQYRCVVKNADGTATSNAAKLSVTKVPPEITLQPESADVAAGEQVTFRVEADHATGYQWYYRKKAKGSWKKVKGATKAAYTVTATSSKNGYQYQVTVTNSDGSVKSDIATLKVN